MKLNWCLLAVLFIQGAGILAKSSDPDGSGKEKSEPPIEIRRDYPEDYMNKRNATAEQATFKKFIYHRHTQRLGMLKDQKKETYSKQYKLLEALFPSLFETILQQRALLESSGYIPGGEWPMNMTVRDAMTQVVEGALFVGEAFLRMPEVTRRVLKSNKEWDLLIGWAWTFSSECRVYLDKKMHIPIDIMGQELGFIEKDPEALKRYREELGEKEAKAEATDVEKLLQEAKKHLKDKKKSERGPRMSSGDL